VLFLTATLQGCASLPRDECKAADWYDMGYQDGLRGRPGRPAAELNADCGNRDPMSPMAVYAQGHVEGLKRFCDPDRGFELGVTGVPYSGICMTEAKSSFAPAYERGRAIFETQLQVRRLAEILQVNTAEREKLATSVKQKQLQLGALEATSAQAIQLLLEMRDLQDTVAMVETEIDGIEAAIEDEKRHLQALRQGAFAQ
jgi:hypothetical protein